MEMDYSKLRTAKLLPEYLHSNATTHSFIFGAMAELVDNSRDAKANTLEVYTEPASGESHSPLLCFLDDGCGMSPEEALTVGSFGASEKTSVADAIGMYGNGLKSGTMKLGKDMILFTKKADDLTCLMISRTFYDAEKINQVIIPSPTYKCSTFEPKDKKRHAMEVALLEKYSPFKTEEQLKGQFNKITGESGTLVICYNLYHDATGEYELDFDKDPEDIRTAESTEDDDSSADMPERTSFRAYVSILYKSPRMKIILRGKKVRTRLLEYSLYQTKMIVCNYDSFKNQAEAKLKLKQRECKEAEDKVKKIKGIINHLSKQGAETNRIMIAKLRKMNMDLAKAQQHHEEKKKEVELHKMQSKSKKPLKFYFGINIERRDHDGMFFYNADRLIKMYDREGTLQSKEEVTYRGIVAIVSVPKCSLVPTHNKQEFEDQQEFKKLKKTVSQAMKQYLEWLQTNLTAKGKNTTAMYKEMGYGSDWRKPPSNQDDFRLRRARETLRLQQCDLCLKWRVVPYRKDILTQQFPDNWKCSDIQRDNEQNACSKSEQLSKIPSAEFKMEKKAKKETAGKSNGRTIPQPERKSSIPPDVANGAEVFAAERMMQENLNRKRTSLPIWGEPSSDSGAMLHGKSTLSTHSTKDSRTSRKSLSAPRQNSGYAQSPAQKSKKTTAPPLRIMRRASPSRTVRPATATTTSPSKAAHPAVATTTMRSSSPVNVPPRKRSRIVTPPPSPCDQLANSEEETEKRRNKNVEKSYRPLTCQDLLRDSIVGECVQGRFKNEWQDAKIMECRGTSALVCLKNKTKIQLKVASPEQGIHKSEIRIELKPGEVFKAKEPTTSHEASSTTTGDLLTLPIEAQKMIDAHKIVIKSLNSSMDTDSMTLVQLADLDLADILGDHDDCIQKNRAKQNMLNLCLEDFEQSDALFDCSIVMNYRLITLLREKFRAQLVTSMTERDVFMREKSKHEEMLERERARHEKVLEKYKADMKMKYSDSQKRLESKHAEVLTAQVKLAEDEKQMMKDTEKARWVEIGKLFKEICAACNEEENEEQQDIDSYKTLKDTMENIRKQFNEQEGEDVAES